MFVIGVSNLKTDPIENDEFRTLNHIEPVWLTTTRTVPETIQSVASLSPQHGPLYFVILNVWHKLAGADLFSLRLLSTYFGLLSIAMTYRLAAVMGKKDYASAAAVALAFIAFYAFFTHYLRMYTLLSIICGWTVWSYWLVVRKPSVSRWIWISLFISTAILPYVHYLGGTVIAAIGAYHIFFAGKGRRWRQALAVMAGAGLLFLPWIPVAIGGFAGHQLDSSATRLTFIESIRAVLSIFSNGILLFPLLVVALASLNFRRLNGAERYLAFVTICMTVLIFILNAFAPIIVANRMRYATVLAVPLCCFAVIGLRMLPGWPLLRFPILALWCVSFFYYTGSEDYAIYTNILQHETEKIPNYQDFIYESESLPGHNELILSFHPNMVLSSNKTLPYYRSVISRWSYIVHITYDANGELIIQSGHSKYDTLDAITDNSRAIWVLHNPAQTDLDSMPVYADWFLSLFKACKRFRDSEFSVIEYYVKNSVPCSLITADAPFSIRYDIGIDLANAVVERTDRELSFYLWWRRTIARDYAFSIQVFDQSMAKVRQFDAVISGEPIDGFSLDLSGLLPGEYTAELIVYNIETKASQPGRFIGDQERVERSVTIARFTLED